MATKVKNSTDCAQCLKMEQQYLKNPRSLRLRLWKWHTGWCPAYKKHQKAAAGK